MRFHLIDRILEVDAGKKIRIVKNLSLAEEYLADHFPGFPVMPGVLMLETLVEAGAWLLRISDDFRHSVIALRDARNVKYGSFMEPGKTLEATVDLEKIDTSGGEVSFRGKGECDGQATVSARFTVARYNLADRDPALEAVDRRLVAHWRRVYTSIR